MKASEIVNTAFFILQFAKRICKVSEYPIFNAEFVRWAKDQIARFFSLCRAYQAKLQDWQLSVKAVWQTLTDFDYRQLTLSALLTWAERIAKPYKPTLFATNYVGKELQNVYCIRGKGQRRVNCAHKTEFLVESFAKGRVIQ